MENISTLARIERSSYKEEALKSVISDSLGKELEEKKLTGDERSNFISQKTGVYLDALFRGYPVLVDLINKEGISEELASGLGRKVYAFENGQMVFKYKALSDDPMDRIRLNRFLNMMDYERQGEVEFFEDEFLIKKGILIGQDIQLSLYTEFKEAYDVITKVIGEASSILVYTPSIRHHFLDLVKLFPEGIESLEGFINRHKYRTSFPNAGQIKDTFLSVKYLNDLIGYFSPNFKNPINRGQCESSIMVSLILHPEDIDISSFSEPLTSVEEAESFKNIVNFIKKNPGQEDRLSGLLVYKTLQDNEGSLRSLFGSMKIDPNLGMEYLHYMLFSKLRSFIKEDYTFEGKDDKFYKNFNIRTEGVSLSRASGEILDREKSEVRDFIKVIVKKMSGRSTPFKKRNFLKLSLDARRSFFDALFIKDFKENLSGCRDLFEIIFREFPAHYDKDSHLFVIDHPNIDYGLGIIAASVESAYLFLSSVLKKIEEGREDMEEVARYYVLREVVLDYLYSGNFTFTQSSVLNHLKGIKPDNQRYKKIDEVVLYIAPVMLFLYFKSKPFSLKREYTLDYLINLVSKSTFFVVDDKERIYLSEQINSKFDEMLNNVKETYLKDVLDKNGEIDIVSLLDNSLSDQEKRLDRLLAKKDFISS